VERQQSADAGAPVEKWRQRMPSREGCDEREVARQVKSLYENIGWTNVGEVTYDARSSEDLRRVAVSYISDCRLRVLRHLPKTGDRLLDMASGPIQYPEYLRYSAGFNTRVCVDLSKRALEIARSRLGAHGEYLEGDFLNLAVEPVDAAVSLHTIYHIHKESQEQAVRKLIDLTKPGGTIVIVYSNPLNLVSSVLSPFRRVAELFAPRRSKGDTPGSIYFERFPLSWWKRFSDSGTVRIMPWRTFSTPVQRLLFPDNNLGQWMFSSLFALEDRYPRLFAAIGCYPMIVIDKRAKA
jgi:SAM-dependent methyltransferase